MIIGMYLFVADPYGMKPLLFGTPVSIQSSDVPESSTQNVADTSTSTGETTVEDSTTVAASGGFELSDAQVEALISLGVDPQTVPSTVSAQQEACFVEALGEARVAEVKAGAVPSALEFMKAKSCI